jgi:hypothetical protein
MARSVVNSPTIVAIGVSVKPAGGEFGIEGDSILACGPGRSSAIVLLDPAQSNSEVAMRAAQRHAMGENDATPLA